MKVSFESLKSQHLTKQLVESLVLIRKRYQPPTDGHLWCDAVRLSLSSLTLVVGERKVHCWFLDMWSITPAHIHRITPLRCRCHLSENHFLPVYVSFLLCFFLVLFTSVLLCHQAESESGPGSMSLKSLRMKVRQSVSKACEPWPPRAWPTKQVLDGQDMFCYLAPLSITLDITLSHRDWEYVYELDKSPQGFPVQHVTNQKRRLICQQPSS